MSFLNQNYLSQSLLLAGTLSLSSGLAQAQTLPAAEGNSPACRAIDPNVKQNAKTLESLYTGVGVLKNPGDAGTPLAPPRTPMPLGMGLKEFPYMAGTDSRSFNLALFGGGSSKAMKCLLSELQYDASVGEKIDKQAEAITGDSEQAEFISKLSASDSLNLSLYRTVRLMNFFRTDVDDKDVSIGGNTDGNPDVLTASEIENWAWKLTNEDEATYKTMGGNAISRVHSMLGLLQFVSTPPPAAPHHDPVVVTAPESSKEPWYGVLGHVPQGVWWVGGTLAVVGLLLALRRGEKSSTPKSDEPKNQKGGNDGRGSGAVSAPKVEVTINNVSPAKTEVKTEGVYDDVLQNLNPGSPNENVLKALEEGDVEKKTSNNPFHEIMTYSVDDAAIAKALSKVDPALVEFYRKNISNDASRVSTFSDLLARISIEDPDALSAVQAAIAVEGRPATEMAERFIFELIAKAADWKPADAAARSSLVGKFEADVRAEHGMKPGESSDAAEKAKRETEEAKSKTKVLEKK